MDTIEIIIPSYNRPKNRKKLLHSLLKQTTNNYKITVVIDALKNISEVRELKKEFFLSRHEKIEIPEIKGKINIYENKSQKIRIIIKPYRSGQGNCRNLGVKLSTASFILFLDDDIMIPEQDWLQKRVAHFLSQKKDKILTMGNITFPPHTQLNDYTKKWDLGGLVPYFPSKLFFYQVFTSNLLGHRESFFKNPFNSLFKTYGIEDLEFAYRLYKKGYEFFLDKTSFTYHHNKLTLQKLTHRFQSIGKNRLLMVALHPETMLIFDTIASYIFFEEKFLFHEHDFKKEEIQGAIQFLEELSFYIIVQSKNLSTTILPPHSRGKIPLYLKTKLKWENLSYDWWKRVFLTSIFLFLTPIQKIISADKTTQIEAPFKKGTTKIFPQINKKFSIFSLHFLQHIFSIDDLKLFIKGGRELIAKNYFFHNTPPLEKY
jgi:GT2 family glycosyltransferase